MSVKKYTVPSIERPSANRTLCLIVRYAPMLFCQSQALLRGRLWKGDSQLWGTAILLTPGFIHLLNLWLWRFTLPRVSLHPLPFSSKWPQRMYKRDYIGALVTFFSVLVWLKQTNKQTKTKTNKQTKNVLGATRVKKVTCKSWVVILTKNQDSKPHYLGLPNVFTCLL